MKWPEVKLNRLCNPRQWPTISSRELTDVGYPVYGANGRIGYFDAYNHEEPTVLITCRGATCGTLNICESKSYVTGNAMALDDPNRSLVDFRFLYFGLLQRGLGDTITGAAQPQITRANLDRVTVTLPALSEQQRIVELLEQADALRRQRAEAAALAARIPPALFRKMFGDPATNPKNWPTRPLGKSLRPVSGGTPSKANPEYWRGTVPWVSPKDMKSVVITDTADHITKEAIEKSAAPLIPQGAAIIVIRSGILAHSVPVAIAGTDMAINQDLKALLPNPKEFHPHYLLGWMLASKQTLLGCVKRGATVHSMDSGKFLSLPLMSPPPERQKMFAGKFKALLRMETERTAAGKSIEALFQNMLHRAFTGELTARWREAHLKELLAEMEHQARLLNKNGAGK